MPSTSAPSSSTAVFLKIASSGTVFDLFLGHWRRGRTRLRRLLRLKQLVQFLAEKRAAKGAGSCGFRIHALRRLCQPVIVAASPDGFLPNLRVCLEIRDVEIGNGKHGATKSRRDQ